jgi:hypothetical protein
MFFMGVLGSGLFSLGSIMSANKHSTLSNVLFITGSTLGTLLAMMLGGWLKK